MEEIKKVNYKWAIAKKFAFRFFLIFFLLYILLNPNGVLPYSYKAFEYYIQPLNNFLIWAAAHILQLSKPVVFTPTGSGDTTLDYLRMLFLVVFSFVGMLIWSIFDSKRTSYNKLYYWLTVMVRYYAGITMVCYGCVKIIKLQFPAPSLYRLLEPYGQSSPMGLAWTFMGHSIGYNYFTGIAELSCGVLLFFRKTSRLGSVLLLIVAGNIMAINYCFDVPVKLLSTMLVVMALFLISRDAQQFINFFLLNKTAIQSDLSPHRFKKTWINVTVTAVKYVLIIYVIVVNFYQSISMEKVYGSLAKKPPLYGIYNVEYFIRNHDTIAPLATDTSLWKKLIIKDKDNAGVQFANDTLRSFSFNNDVDRKTIEFVQTDVETGNYIFNYTKPKPDLLLLK